MSVAYQTTLKNSNQSKENDIERYDITKKFSPVLDNGDRVLIRNISKRGGTGKISSFWAEKVHMVVENIQNEKVIFKISKTRKKRNWWKNACST